MHETPTTDFPLSTTLTIDGMSCGHCVRAVRDALTAVPGADVEAVAVGEARVRVQGDAAREAAVAAVEAEGFRVTRTA